MSLVKLCLITFLKIGVISAYFKNIRKISAFYTIIEDFRRSLSMHALPQLTMILIGMAFKVLALVF